MQNKKLMLLHETIKDKMESILDFLKHLFARMSNLDSSINEQITEAVEDVTVSIKKVVVEQVDDVARKQVTVSQLTTSRPMMPLL